MPCVPNSQYLTREDLGVQKPATGVRHHILLTRSGSPECQGTFCDRTQTVAVNGNVKGK